MTALLPGNEDEGGFIISVDLDVAEYAYGRFNRLRDNNGAYKSSIAAVGMLSDHGLFGYEANLKRAVDAESFFAVVANRVVETALATRDFDAAFRAGLQFVAAPFHAHYADDVGVALVGIIAELDDSDPERQTRGEWLNAVCNWIALRYWDGNFDASFVDWMLKNDIHLKASGEFDRILDDGVRADAHIQGALREL